jgi:hypothetical protein
MLLDISIVERVSEFLFKLFFFVLLLLTILLTKETLLVFLYPAPIYSNMKVH